MLVHAVYLEHVLRQVEANGRNLHGGRSSSSSSGGRQRFHFGTSRCRYGWGASIPLVVQLVTPELGGHLLQVLCLDVLPLLVQARGALSHPFDLGHRKPRFSTTTVQIYSIVERVQGTLAVDRTSS